MRSRNCRLTDSRKCRGIKVGLGARKIHGQSDPQYEYERKTVKPGLCINQIYEEVTYGDVVIAMQRVS